MNPNYIHTITIYRNIDGAWTRTVLHNCFWKSGIAVTQNGTEANQSNTYTVRIPMDAVSDPLSARTGDVVVKGEVLDEITGQSTNTAVQLLQKYKPDAFSVTAFADNTSHLMDKHYRLGG